MKRDIINVLSHENFKQTLSHENFKQTTDDLFKYKNTTTPAFTTPRLFTQFFSKTYTDYKKQQTNALFETS
jgi:hypothetical protein